MTRFHPSVWFIDVLMYFLLPSHLLDKTFSFLESLQFTELNLCSSLKDHTVWMNLEILLMVQCWLQTRMLRNIVLMAVLLPIYNATVQAKMFQNTAWNDIKEKKNHFILISASIRNRLIRLRRKTVWKKMFQPAEWEIKISTNVNITSKTAHNIQSY